MPALFYSAPPGGAPLLLAIGHEFVLGSYLGPPLSFWLGELAFRLGGAFGLYALGAGLHRSHLLVGVHARPPHRRHAPCGAGRAAAGRRFGLHGAEPGFRSGGPGGAVLGPGAAALLARGHRARARLLVSARGRSWPAAARELRRTDPDCADGRVHAGDGARARVAVSCRSLDRAVAVCHRHLSAFAVAERRTRSRHLGPQRQERGDRHAAARPLALRRAGGDPSRPRRDGRVRRRLAEAAAARTADRAQSGRSCSDGRSSTSSR